MRPFAARLQEVAGRTVVIDYRPGANGVIGTQHVINAPADGNTMLFGITSLIQHVAVAKTKPYDPFRDLQPVALIGRTNAVLAVTAASPWKTVQELIKAMQASPGGFAYGSFGSGSASHIYGEALKLAAKVDIPHVPSKGMAPLLVEMLAGRIQYAFVAATTAVEKERDKRFRMLGTAGPTRMALLPHVPTLTEEGLSGFEPTGWWAFFVRSGTPKPVTDRLTADIRKVLLEPEIAMRLKESALDAADDSPQQFAAAMKSDFHIWESLARRLNISLD
jgi:tripartite-type tricarboxylate transporter receptor subunit TctC